MTHKITLITDAWKPQINGVVTTLLATQKSLEDRGYTVSVISPQNEEFQRQKAPKYPEVELVVNPWRVVDLIDLDSMIHIATEGPLGVFSSLFLGKVHVPFTTSYHTKTPEFLHTHWNIPLSWGYFFLRSYHKKSRAVLVTTREMKNFLMSKKLHSNLVVWGRGVDTELFHPKHRKVTGTDKVLLYVGRVSSEKTMLPFLELDIPGTTKVVVGDGPQRKEYESRYADVRFVGFKQGVELAEYYASADVFVFPSTWDTFGVVQIEAASCGTPIATFKDSLSSKDVITNGINGYARLFLQEAVHNCLSLDRDKVRAHTVENFSWETCTEAFLTALQSVKSPVPLLDRKI